MKIEQSFMVARPVDEVWAYFQNVPVVAACMPGATLTEDRGGGTYAGKLTLKLGLFSAAFEGEARVRFDEASRSGHVDGKGVDRRGGSRSQLSLDFQLVPVSEGTRTDLQADVQLSGAIAQFGRSGLIQETSNILIRDFVACLEQRLAPVAGGAGAGTGATAAPAPPRAIGVFGLMLRGLLAWVRRLFRRGG